ncbi:MAG: gliding motility-associated C-terminal domain-containing protein, partial [Brumimicrobium sp.]
VIDPTCTSDGIATITNVGAGITYNFTPSGPTVDGATGVISNVAAGTSYTVIAEENSCFSSGATFQVEPQIITPDEPIVAVTPPTCTTDGSGIISNYDGSYTYTFTPAGPSVDASGNVTGATFGTAYDVTATFSAFASSCESSPANFTIDEILPTPTVSVVENDPTDCGGNGSLDFTITDIADGSYTINYNTTDSWSVTVTGGTTSVTAVAGTYSNITIENQHGCESLPVSATLTDPNAPDVPIITVIDPTCTSDGIATITNVGAGITYNFTPSGPTVDGATGVISNVTAGTSYTVEAEENNCVSADATFQVEPQIITPDEPIVAVTPPTCTTDGSAIVSNYDGSYTYTFTPTGPSVDASGNVTGATFGTAYDVTATFSAFASSCESSPANFTIGGMLPTPTVSIVSNYSICGGSEIVLVVNNPDNALTYEWYLAGDYVETGSSLIISKASSDNAGEYTVVAINSDGCEEIAVTDLEVKACEVYPPEAFSPNGDGVNDFFEIKDLEGYPGSEMSIYNRWGAEVFYSDNYQNDWDGTSQSKLNIGGNELPEGTYYYVLRLGGIKGQEGYDTVKKGFVYLRR